LIDDNYADADGDDLEDEGLDEGLDLSKAERHGPIKHMRLVSDEVARHESRYGSQRAHRDLSQVEMILTIEHMNHFANFAFVQTF
jgi:hypothetical protein